MFSSTVTVDAHQTLADAVSRLEGVAGEAQIVVRQRTAGLPRFYLYRAAFLRTMAQRDPTRTVAAALNLSASGAAHTLAADQAAGSADGPAVVLDGDSVLGVLLGESGDRGAAAPTPTEPPIARKPPGRPGGLGGLRLPDRIDLSKVSKLPGISTRPVVPLLPGITERSLPSELSAVGEDPFGDPGDDGSEDLGAEGFGDPGEDPQTRMNRQPDHADAVDATTTPTTTPPPFTASAAVTSPAQAFVGQPFDVIVGLAPPPAAGGTGGGVLVVDTGLAEFDLVVSLAAPGFTAARIRDVLHVVRADPSAQTVTFTLTPDPLDAPVAAGLLRIDFSFGGIPCGTEYRSVVVTAPSALPTTASAPPPPPERSPQPPAPLPITVIESERAPDLVITITENDDSTQLEWQFDSRHADIPLPTTAARTRFQQQNAQSFAMQQIRLVHESIGDAAIDTKITGVSRTIADQIPAEAWRMLTAAWQKAAAESRLPGVLIVSTDAYVPWELASTEDVYLDTAPTDPAIAPILGAQVPISRWQVPNPRGVQGVLAPPLPPPEALDVAAVAVVTGDYLVTSGQRPLPMAMEEGNELSALYSATRLTATLQEIDPLFDGKLEQDGVRITPDLVHFACHGQADLNPRFNGIILNDNVRLDPLYVAGRRRAKGFVFMNACQIGQNTQLLEEAGGFATQFLNTGASGFVAPLWNVDDQVAKDTAIGFYGATLGTERVTVAEALRRRRALYDPNAAAPQPTHLAYIYYGHPNLVLTPHPPVAAEGAPA